MLQPTTVCPNKVQVEFKEEEELCRDQEFFCCNIAEEKCEEDCHNTLCSVATVSKANGIGTFSLQSLLCHIKG